MSGHVYDDGDLAVPGGCAGPVQRVIVIGAGISGLAVGNALTHAGVECLVLEARDRMGGRLHTVDVGGVPIDLGGSWIHTPVGNPLRRFADQAGVECRDGNPLYETVGYDSTEGRRLSDAELGALMEMHDGFPEAHDELLEVLGPTASAAEGIDRFVAGSGLDGADARRARLLLRQAVAAEAADTPERQSLRWLWNEAEYDGDFLGDVPVGGYRRLTEALAEGVSVRLGAEVSSIEVSATGVLVATKDGGVESCSHAVVTVPLGVLKRGSVRFAPELPDDRRAAIDRLGFGSFEKIAVSFDSPFWRDASVPHLLAFPRDDASILIIGQDAFGAGPALVGLVGADNCGHLLGRSPDAADWMLRIIGEAIGRPCPEPTAIAVSSWTTDPYAGGAYAHNTPASSPADVDLLGEPLGGRLLFAGEATTTTRMGFADGAFQTGIREAKRLLRQPAVSLAVWRG